MPTTVSFPEYVWLVSAVAGLIITSLLLIDAIRDTQASRAGNKVQQIIATGRLHTEICRMIAQIILLEMVVRAADSPLGARLEPEHFVILTIFRAEYILSIVSVTMLIGSAISYRTKYLVRRAVKQQHAT